MLRLFITEDLVVFFFIYPILVILFLIIFEIFFIKDLLLLEAVNKPIYNVYIIIADKASPEKSCPQSDK